MRSASSLRKQVRHRRPIVETLEDRIVPTTWYVATNGSNSNNGTSLTTPFATIQAGANAAKPGDFVEIRGGTYREQVSLPTYATDSTHRITFESYHGEAVTIDGADVVSGLWTNVSGNIFSASNVTGVVSNLNSADQVFLDGQMLNLARYPNTSLDVSHPSYLRVQGQPPTPTQVSGSSTLVQTTISNSALTQAAGYWVGATIHFVAGHFIGRTGTVTASAPGSLTIQWNGSADYYSQPNDTDQFYLFGRYQDLDAAGEWYRDPAANKLYVWSPDGTNPEGHTVEVKHRDYAFVMNDNSYVTIQNISLFACTISTETAALGEVGIGAATGIGDLLSGLQAKYVSHFTDLSYSNSIDPYSAWATASGIILAGTGQTLQNSRIQYSAGSGIVTYGSGNLVQNNVVLDTDYAACVDCAGISTGNESVTSTDHQILNNTVARTAGTIILGRTFTNSNPANPLARVAYNDLSEGALQSADVGAFYTWHDNGNGARIDHNFIHDAGTNGEGYGVNAVYIDDGSSNFVVDHNVSFDEGPFVINGIAANAPTSGIELLNNTTYNTNGVGLTLAPYSDNNTIENNIFSGGIALGTASDGGNNAHSTISYNAGTVLVTAGNPNPTQLNVTANPLFSNPAAHDFTLQAGSPCINAGIAVAPYTNGYVGSAPDIGAYEYGTTAWTAGANLAVPVAAPTNLSASSSDGRTVNLTWSVPGNEASITLQRSLDGTNWTTVAVLPGGSTAFTDAVTYGYNYTYRIRADLSAFSNVATAAINRNALTPLYAAAADAYTGDIYVAGGNAVYSSPNSYMEWKSVDFGALNSITTFNIPLSYTVPGSHILLHLDSPTGTLIGTLTTTAVSGTTLESTSVSGASGVHDLYVVFDAWGTANLNYIYFTGTTSVAAPSAPSGLGVAVTANTSNKLTWTNNSTQASEVDVERSTDGSTFSQIAKLSGSTTTYTDTAVGSATPYFYRVRAADAAGWSPYSTTVYAAVTAPPAGWADTNIGSPGKKGNITYDGSFATITGGGADIWSTSDQFNFVSRSYSGDGTIVARVDSITNTNTWAKAGVMFRASTAANSAFVDVVVTPGQGVSFQWRATAGGSCNYSQVTGLTALLWVSLTRAGNSFSAAYSSDGTTWTAIGSSQTITLPSAAQVGLAVTAHDNTKLATATFTHFGIRSAIHTSQTPTNPNATDGVPYELGTKFQSSSAGIITAIRYYRAPSETGTHIGHLWDSFGNLLATVVFGNETSSGWQMAYLVTPVAIRANTAYVVSVSINAYFAVTTNGLSSSITNGPLSTIGAGLFGTQGELPTSTYMNSDYFVDPVFSGQ